MTRIVERHQGEDPVQHAPRHFYRIPEFAAEHRVGRSTVYREIKAGRLRVKKVGRSTLISAEDAAAWRESLPEYKPQHRGKS